jgi:hypothetical protein
MKLILLLALVLCGCAGYDGQLTKFQPLRQQDQQQIWLFSTSANAVYPLDSEAAEKIRIGWLEDWLTKHGLDNKNYTILSRKVVPDDSGLIGTNYFMYYEVAAN